MACTWYTLNMLAWGLSNYLSSVQKRSRGKRDCALAPCWHLWLHTHPGNLGIKVVGIKDGTVCSLKHEDLLKEAIFSMFSLHTLQLASFSLSFFFFVCNWVSSFLAFTQVALVMVLAKCQRVLYTQAQPISRHWHCPSSALRANCIFFLFGFWEH